MISRYEVTERGVQVFTPYCEDVVSQCRKWGGKFDKGRGCWVVNKSRLPAVQEQLGVNAGDQVEIEVGRDDFTGYQQYRVGWFVLAGRRGRDQAADLYADLVAGEIPERGGSVKNPAVNASSDARFRLWVPRDFALAKNLPIVPSPAVENPECPTIESNG